MWDEEEDIDVDYAELEEIEGRPTRKVDEEEDEEYDWEKEILAEAGISSPDFDEDSLEY